MNLPIRQNINNSSIAGVHSMPMSDNSTDRAGTFSFNRRLYSETIQTQLSHSEKKKWMSTANRDSSKITTFRRINSVGNGTMNANGTQHSFVSHDNVCRIDALARVRGGGAAVPPKVAHSPHANKPVITPTPLRLSFANKWVKPPVTKSRLFLNAPRCDQEKCLREIDEARAKLIADSKK